MFKSKIEEKKITLERRFIGKGQGEKNIFYTKSILNDGTFLHTLECPDLNKVSTILLETESIPEEQLERLALAFSKIIKSIGKTEMRI